MKCPGTKEKFDDIAFVRLQPIELDGRDRADVQAVDLGRIDQLALPLLISGDRAADQGGPDLLKHLLLRAADDANEGEHVLSIGQLQLRRVTMNHRRTQIRAAFLFREARSESGGHVLSARLPESRLNLGPNRPRRPGHGEGGEAGLRVFGRPVSNRSQALG